MDVRRLLTEVATWAASQPAVHGVAVVGSWARRTAGPGLDIDLVVMVDEPETWLLHTDWIERFGMSTCLAVEDYGTVQSMRVHYTDGLEVEFGFTTLSWASLPLDDGTAHVLKNGVDVLYDPTGDANATGPSITPAAPVASEVWSG